jgi:nucleoside-diphosphate kinase
MPSSAAWSARSWPGSSARGSRWSRPSSARSTEQHYAEHLGKAFYGELVGFVTRSPVFAMVVEGPDENTFLLVRKLVGATNVEDAEPGTIRGDFATTTTENLVHASDGHESAAREIALWFPDVA